MTAGVGCGAVLWNAWPWSQLVTGETRSGREPKLTQELQNASTGSGPAEGGRQSLDEVAGSSSSGDRLAGSYLYIFVDRYY